MRQAADMLQAVRHAPGRRLQHLPRRDRPNPPSELACARLDPRKHRRHACVDAVRVLAAAALALAYLAGNDADGDVLAILENEKRRPRVVLKNTCVETCV